jgi:hypothetical protein
LLVEGRLEPPSADTAERVSKDLLAIIWHATSTAPSARFGSADEFAEELRQFVAARRPMPRAVASARMLTVQQHAEMTAAIEAHPEQTEELRDRYGIVSSTRMRAVDAWWKENIESHPKVHAKWRALVDLYRRRLKGR